MNRAKSILLVVILYFSIHTCLTAQPNMLTKNSNSLLLNSKKILVVDRTDHYFTNNLNSADSLRVTLESLGYTVDLLIQLPSAIDTSTYAAVFCCMGMFPYNGILTDTDIHVLSD